MREGEKMKLWFREAGRHFFQYTDPPGYLPPQVRTRMIKARAEGRRLSIRSARRRRRPSPMSSTPRSRS